MNCPHDGTVLALSERNGIEIDYCPQCRGVWLDRGELDKILDRADAGFGYPARSVRDGDRSREDQARARRYDDDRSYGGHSKKRGGWLGELFD